MAKSNVALWRLVLARAVARIFEPLQKAVVACLPHLEHDKLRASARMLWASVHGLCVLQGVDKLSVLVEQKAADSMIHEVVDVFIAGLQNGVQLTSI